MNNKVMIYGSLMKIDVGAPGMVMLNLIENSTHQFLAWAYDADNPKFEVKTFKKNTIRSFLTLVIRLVPYKLKKKWFLSTNPNLISYYLHVAWAVRKNKLKLAVVHVSYALCWIIKFFSPKTEVVYYHHGGNMHVKLDQNQWKLLCKSCNQLIISVTQYAINGCRKKFRLTPINMVCIQNGLVKSDLITVKQKSHSTFTLVYAGRFTFSKGIDKLLLAFEELVKQGKNIHLLLIGKMPDKCEDTKAEKLIKIYNQLMPETRAKINITGLIPNHEVKNLLNHAHAAILLSQETEGNSLFGIEALHAGLPIIVTDIGGNNELNNPENPCCLILDKTKKQIDAIKETITYFIDNPDVLKTYSLNASKRAKHFTLERMVNEFDAAMNKITCAE